MSFKIPQIFEVRKNTSKKIQYRGAWEGDKRRLVDLILSAVFHGFKQDSKQGTHEIRFTVLREIVLWKLNNRTPVQR